jgi:hypothetical protein
MSGNGKRIDKTDYNFSQSHLARSNFRFHRILTVEGSDGRGAGLLREPPLTRRPSSGRIWLEANHKGEAIRLSPRLSHSNGKRVSAHRPSGAEAECVGATATPCSEAVVPSIKRRDRPFYQDPWNVDNVDNVEFI